MSVPKFLPLLLTCACALALSGCGADPVPAPGPDVGTRLDGALPKAIEDIPLVDSTGHTRHLSDFAGKVVVISDSMTLCQESCPMDTAALVHTAREVDRAGHRKDVEFLTITVDPQRDTVPQMAAYRKQYDGPANWLALTGTKEHVAQLWKYLGVYRKKVPSDDPGTRNWRTGKPLTYDIEHSDETFFVDGKGHERFILEGMPHIPGKKQIPAKIYHFLSDEGRQNLRSPGAMSWTEPQAVDVVSWLLDDRIT